MKKYLILILVSLFLISCRNPEMEKRFADNQTRIMTDELGRKYIVRHRDCENYSISPYEPEVQIEKSK